VDKASFYEPYTTAKALVEVDLILSNPFSYLATAIDVPALKTDRLLKRAD
jgi:hypothetical protein